MRILTALLLSAALLFLFACTAEHNSVPANQPMMAQRPEADSPRSQQLANAKSTLSAGSVTSTGGRDEQVSLASATAVQAASLAAERKVIRNSDLTIETDAPNEGLRKITSIAEAHGGFVVTSEFKQSEGSGQTRPSQTVTVVARVPSSQFGSALEQIRGAGNRVIQEKVSGQDVSEEYLDIEARIRTKKALEAQFLEIMKQARKVSDALEVQSQLADVRTEIERLEGRRRFLENQSALSTITTTLQMPQPIVATTSSGFGATIKHTFGDAVDMAASIVLFIIQAMIVLVPLAFFFGLPGWLVWRLLQRRGLVRKPEPSAVVGK